MGNIVGYYWKQYQQDTNKHDNCNEMEHVELIIKEKHWKYKLK